MFQEREQRRESALVPRQREPLLLVLDAHADRPAFGVVGQGEEDVFLLAVANEVAAQWRVFEHGVGLLHAEGTPVEAAAFQLGGGLRDDVAVLLAGEKREVGEVHARDGSTRRIGNGDRIRDWIWRRRLKVFPVDGR